ncbi:hypothetical protein Ahu01nite_015710 [Winogradskya humida]|uniref:Uncharacterized protein n=1 Tax=Winogradskya humida TaxID=113566 RepID=A0ABQ3ZIR5_9ACTN|nr:hypothetical protein Ahu01nite_015710 [Actinoplanes humidus]
MSGHSESRTVTTRYVWVPHGSSGGWLLVHRSIETGGVSDDFWITGEIAPEDASDVLKDSAEGWAPLVLGEQVNFLLWPYVLTAVTGRQLRKVREQLLLTPVRPLADIRVTVTDTPDGPEVSSPSITLADDPFMPGHDDLHLTPEWERGSLDASTRRAELLTAMAGKLSLPAADPAHVVVVNRFVARDDRAGLDEVLARRSVRAAIAALLAEPTQDEPRERLADELLRHGWQFDSVPVMLGGEPKPGFLERLVFFLVLDPRADGSAASYRIATLPSSAALLDPPLMAALAGYLGPFDPALRTTGFRAALAVLPPEWDPPRERGTHLAPPAGDEIVTVRGEGTVDLSDPQIAQIHLVELFDSQGLPRGKFDLSAIPVQPGDSPRVKS